VVETLEVLQGAQQLPGTAPKAAAKRKADAALEGAGAEGVADFESLLRLLRQECVRLCRENATLRVRAARSEQDVDGAADAVDGSPRGTDGFGGREPPPLKLGAGCQEASVAEEVQSARASVTSSAVSREISQRFGGSKTLKERFGIDTGTSESNRKMTAELMQKHLEKRSPKMTYFGFRGAKQLKAKLKWVRNHNFDYAMASVILLNAVYMGTQTWMVMRSTRDDPNSAESAKRSWLIGDVAFALIFVSELITRVFAYQVKFYRGSQRWWNLFDCVTITATVVATFLDAIGTAPSFYINLFRVLRLARLARSLKVSKSRLFHNLKVLSYTVAGSANAFMSAITLLFVVIYVFGLMFMQGLQSYIVRDNADPLVVLQLEAFFGSPADTLFTLLNVITGGDWEDVATTLRDIEPSYQWFFLAYITFTVLCILNILNGVFVTVAIESAQTNKELAIQSTQYKTRALIEQMVEWFIEADKDMSNKVSYEELHDLMRDDKVRAFLRANGIDVSSTAQVFFLLDRDGTGEIEPEEFVDNLILLQGGAKALDLASLRVVCDDLTQKFDDLDDMMRRHIVGLGPPATPSRRQAKIPGGLGCGLRLGWDGPEDDPTSSRPNSFGQPMSVSSMFYRQVTR